MTLEDGQALNLIALTLTEKCKDLGVDCVLLMRIANPLGHHSVTHYVGDSKMVHLKMLTDEAIALPECADTMRVRITN